MGKDGQEARVCECVLNKYVLAMKIPFNCHATAKGFAHTHTHHTHVHTYPDRHKQEEEGLNNSNCLCSRNTPVENRSQSNGGPGHIQVGFSANCKV